MNAPRLANPPAGVPRSEELAPLAAPLRPPARLAPGDEGVGVEAGARGRLSADQAPHPPLAVRHGPRHRGTRPRGGGNPGAPRR